MDCSLPGSSVFGISKARILWDKGGGEGLPFPVPVDFPYPGVEPMSTALADAFFTTEPPGKPLRSKILADFPQHFLKIV